MTATEHILDRSADPPDFTVAYGDLPEQVADVWLPQTDDPSRPLVIFIHGGFWKAAYDRRHAAPAAVALAAAGYPVATIEYRRVGAGGGWPATFDDVAAAVATVPGLVAERAGHERGDVVLMGHSAGGQLVLWAGRTVVCVTGIVALAPVADLARGYALGLGGGAVAAALGGGPDDVPERYAALDPAANLPIGVPTVVVHGRLDEAVPFAIGADWVTASRAAGDATELIDLAEIEHFGVIDPLSPAWPDVMRGLASLHGAGRG